MGAWPGTQVSNYVGIHTGESWKERPVLKPVKPEQVQPNGVDLTVDKVFRQLDAPTLSPNKGFCEPGQMLDISPQEIEGLDGPGWYLPARYYKIEYAETITIPANAIGLVLPRSTLIRTGITTFTAVWDSGYIGKGSGGMLCGTDFYLERGSRVVQLIFIDATTRGKVYDGQYQGEGITTKRIAFDTS